MTFIGLRTILGIGFILSIQPAWGQGLNSLWMGGSDSEGDPPFGGVDLNFITGAAVVTALERNIDFRRTCANITDTDGNLLFSTNGTFVANVTGDTMLNGAGLNPGPYADLYPEGLYLNQAVLIVPDPGDGSHYYLFHNTIDDSQELTAALLYVTEVEMGLDGGLGGVTAKNQILLAEELNPGKLTAVRHGNGRDWWVYCHQANSARYYRFLVDPTGISGPTLQDIGEVWEPQGGQCCFSPDGSMFANYWSVTDLELFDVDRCTGEFSNPIHIPISDGEGLGGVAFSPNGQLLYVSSYIDAYQYDLTAADLAGSQVLIAEWDTFYSPFPPFATVFDMALLAPDGKIYISTSNGTLHLHVINDPDVPGLDCNMVQHQLELPRYFSNSLPNHPNYYLGPLAGSPCDTLGLGLPANPRPLNLSAWPNPSSGSFTLNYAPQPVAGVLEVRDLQCKLVRQERIPAWSQVHTLVMQEAAAGLYLCKLKWGQRGESLHLIIE